MLAVSAYLDQDAAAFPAERAVAFGQFGDALPRGIDMVIVIATRSMWIGA
jgi:hypothetical protein